MNDAPYTIRIVPRDGMGMIYDDWHATVTRVEDGQQIIAISRWLWLLRRKLTRRAIDSAFRRLDERSAKLARVIELEA